MSRGIQRAQVERAARVYNSNQDASRALGITARSFNRLCHKYAVESPYQRRRQRSKTVHRPQPGPRAAGLTLSAGGRVQKRQLS